MFKSEFSLNKGKGLKYRALGFRPLPGLGQKTRKKSKMAVLGSSDELFNFGSWISTQFFIAVFMVIPIFCQTPVFAKL